MFFKNPNLLQRCFLEGWKRFFLINSHSSGDFLIVPNLRLFWISFAEKIQIRRKKTFLRNNTILYEFYSKFATFTDFEKKIMFISTKNKKKHSSYVFEKTYFFSRNNLQKFVDFKKSDSESYGFCPGNWQVNEKKTFALREWVSFRIWIFSENNNCL